MKSISFQTHAMAVDRVERRLRRGTAALDTAGVGYSVGGNAFDSHTLQQVSD
ncbi:MAG: hypothetical protein ACE5F9_13320 [Phycisphaerae bacterium]